MNTIVDSPSAGGGRSSHPGAAVSKARNAVSVAIGFGFLIALQALGYLILGTGRVGMAVSESLLVIENILAAACAWFAFRKARGCASLFWFLFLVTLLVLLVPTILIAITTILQRTLISDAMWRVLFCFYGTPILMMLFLPVSEREGRVSSEVYLDLFQVTIVATLGFYLFFLVPLRGMLPDDALLRNLDLSNVESVFLMVVVLVRAQMVRTRQARDLLLRLGLFVLFCGLVTFIGNSIDAQHLPALSAWWDLGWSLPYAVAALVAVPQERLGQAFADSELPGFPSFLSTNLALVAILSGIQILANHWQSGRAAAVMQAVMVTSLLAFALRLSLTQYRQHQEILQRKKAEQELLASNERVANLLDEARSEAAASAQLSQLASLLQTCRSRDEIFQLLPDFQARLLPCTSGFLSVLNSSRTRAEVVAAWGTPDPVGRSLAPPHDPSPHSSAVPALCVPLMANGEAIGVMTVQYTRPGNDSVINTENPFDRQTQVAYSVADQVAATVAQADLREALRSQAIRDPLTGLFNRRHMEEALQREIQRARRRHRALSVMLLDIDHFKRFNDTYGHSVGDHALILVGETLSKNVRADDYACRYGGEEFLVILTECSLQQAAARAEQIRQCLKNIYAQQEGELPIEITASIGVADLHFAHDRVELLIKRADDALYRAKHEGRDRVVAAPHDDSAPAASAGSIS